MNKKHIHDHLKKKVDDWLASIPDPSLVEVLRRNVIVTGGAIVSLLQGEKPRDYDVYLRTEEACVAVATHYAMQWNRENPGKGLVEIRGQDGRVECFIRSKGEAGDSPAEGSDPLPDDGICSVGDAEAEEYDSVPSQEVANIEGEEPPEKKRDRPKKDDKEAEKKNPYRPVYLSTNALSLSDGIQIVIRFYGPVEEIHKNFDYVHCTSYYDHASGHVELPSEALECIINKELVYHGSKYPLCSLLRMRKFMDRGWHINAGQVVKMCYQLNELNLKDFKTFKDQLIGVDSAYFSMMLGEIQSAMEKPGFEVTQGYLFDLIDRVF